MNGYSVDIKDEELVRVVDKSGIAAANLNEVYELIMRLIRMSRSERKMWEATIKEVVESNKDFLIYIGSENRNQLRHA